MKFSMSEEVQELMMYAGAVLYSCSGQTVSLGLIQGARATGARHLLLFDLQYMDNITRVNVILKVSYLSQV